MTGALPVWALPFVLALLGLALVVGRFTAVAAAVVAASTLAAAVYAGITSLRLPSGSTPAANLLALLPGHLLLLLGLGSLARPDALALVWSVLPVGSAAYDWASRRRSFRGRTSILAGLYAILWLTVLFLLERLIAERKGLSGHAEAVMAVAFCAIGVVFVVTGTLRHRRAVKE